jgi:glycerol uptake facilitator-like aquaporin
MQRRATSAYAAELIGTFLLVLFIALVVTVNSEAGLGYTDLAVVALVHAFALMMIVATIGGVSGAHVNPAVTIALCAIRKITPADAAAYVLVQFAAAILAVLVANALIVDGSYAANLGTVAIAKAFLDGKALPGFFAELIGTFALVWAIMGVAVNASAATAWAPLVIGGTLGFLVMCFGPMTARRSTRRGRSVRRSSPTSSAAPDHGCSPTCSARSSARSRPRGPTRRS